MPPVRSPEGPPPSPSGSRTPGSPTEIRSPEGPPPSSSGSCTPGSPTEIRSPEGPPPSSSGSCTPGSPTEIRSPEGPPPSPSGSCTPGSPTEIRSPERAKPRRPRLPGTGLSHPRTVRAGLAPHSLSKPGPPFGSFRFLSAGRLSTRSAPDSLRPCPPRAPSSRPSTPGCGVFFALIRVKW